MANPRCGGDYSVPQGEGASFFCRPSMYGRYVTIRIIKDGVFPLTLCEVEVYSARRGKWTMTAILSNTEKPKFTFA